MKKTLFRLFIFFAFVSVANAQSDIDNIISTLSAKEKSYNPIQTVVPFLSIAPDSRAGAMGDVGVATSPDASSMHWNPAKYAFIKNDMGLAVSFTPWLANLVNDIYLGYLTFYKRIDDQQVGAVALRYFSLGEIIFTNEYAEYTGQHTPNEFSLDAAYSRKFSDRISGSMAFRYIRSDLSGGGYIGTTESKPGQSYAADISAYYRNTEIDLGETPGILAFGINLSNIGTKMTYTQERSEFIPMNMRLGTALTVNMDSYNSITGALDVNKLLVPTRPEYDADGNIIAGKDPDVSVPVALFQSFYDAPGILVDGKRSVLREELQELMYSAGLEYWYNNQFAIRGGYFYEHIRKGNRKYFTVGLGLKLNLIGVDFSYLIPATSGNSGTHPLANTVRFSLTFDLGSKNAAAL